jgi:gluconate transporter
VLIKKIEMDHLSLLFAVLAGISLLLVLILYFKVHAFTSLSIASITVGVLGGMPPTEIIGSLQKGMGETLGFVAGVIGLGAMLGAILEHSGGAHALGKYLLDKTGEKNAPWAMTLTGLLLTIPIFFNVAYIILNPMIYAVQRHTGRPLLFYAIPLLAGMSVSHAFLPPAAGPIAVSEIIGADLGYVIITGLLAGIPGAIIAGPVFGKWISKKIHIAPSSEVETQQEFTDLPPAGLIIFLISIPIFLIILTTFINSPLAAPLNIPPMIKNWMKLAGHPFTALIVVNLIAWYMLGIRRGFSKEKLAEITGKSLAPAGVIILITGAGGMFKQILTETGAGKMLAEAMVATGISYILCAFLISSLVRALQGSTTVAMITSAGMTASLIAGKAIGPLEKALIVTAISCGGIMFSHVTDSGFWLVKHYLNLSEKQTLASWSVMTSMIAVIGFSILLLIRFLFI